MSRENDPFPPEQREKIDAAWDGVDRAEAAHKACVLAGDVPPSGEMQYRFQVRHAWSRLSEALGVRGDPPKKAE